MLPAVARLDDIPGISRAVAQAIIAGARLSAARN